MTRKYKKSGVPETKEYQKKIAAIKFGSHKTTIEFAEKMGVGVTRFRYMMYHGFNLINAIKFQHLTKNYLKIEELLGEEKQREFENFKMR